MKLPCRLMGPHTRESEFTGRDEVLKAIDSILLPLTTPSPIEGTARASLRSYALHGSGGAGKTQIALQYAYSRLSLFPAIFWVQADEASKIADGYNHIALKLNLVSGREAHDSVICRSKLMEWLSLPFEDEVISTGIETPPGAMVVPWLLILDNANKPELLRDYWPVGGKGSVLVTSKDPNVDSYLCCEIGLRLPALGENEAASLLCRLAKVEEGDEARSESMKVVRRLGCLPLAVKIVAAYIRQNHLTFREFVVQYESEEATMTEVHRMGMIKLPERPIGNLSAAWAMEQLSSLALGLLELLSIWDPDRIPELLIQHEHVPIGFPSSQTQYTAARNELIKAALIDRHLVTGDLSLHQLVQDGARSQMHADRLKTMFEFGVHLLNAQWASDYDKFSHRVADWPSADIIMPHVVKMQNVLDKRLSAKLDVVGQGAFAEQLQRCGWYVESFPPVLD